VTGDWRAYRPAIWLTMIGIAIIIIVSPHYLGAFFIGGAIGAAIRIRQRERRRAQAEALAGSRRRRRGGSDPGRRRSR
jgi:hypothetical protein